MITATSASDFFVLITICTASVFQCGLKRRRFSGMDNPQSSELCPRSLVHLRLTQAQILIRKYDAFLLKDTVDART
jgi:hypothetical protein